MLQLTIPEQVPQPKFVRDNLQIDDIQGVRSKRLYRGPVKDIFKLDGIEGAHPHKRRRSPKEFAFDDYKDVTSARKYRRPFMKNSQNIHNQFFDQPNTTTHRQYSKNNYKVPEDLYNKMNYYNLPKIGNTTDKRKEKPYKQLSSIYS